MGYGDYLEPLTYLLFLKMAHEQSQEPYNRDSRIPAGFDGESLRGKTGEPLEAHYLAVLHTLGTETERFRFYSHADLTARDKASLDVFWLKDDSLERLDDLPAPEVLQQEIIEHLEAALASFREMAEGLRREDVRK